MQIKIILLNFVCLYLCLPSSSYEWDSANLKNNVPIFANFLDDIYTEYRKNDKMDLIFLEKQYYQEEFSDAQKRTVFNFTFVKWASELAHFCVNNVDKQTETLSDKLKRVLFDFTFWKWAAGIAHFRVNNGNNNNNNNNTGDDAEPYDQQNLNVNVSQTNKYNFPGFTHYDQSLGHKIAQKFKSEIFAPQKQIQKNVMNQILQLTISFSIRIVLCVIFDDYYKIYPGIGEWQLKTLLTAYKKLSNENDNNKMNDQNDGIFPFKIIETDEKVENYYWAQNLAPKQEELDENIISEQQKFIENFKFILKLSEYELTYYEIYKILDAIMKQTYTNMQKTPKFHVVMEKHFSLANENEHNTPKIFSLIENHFTQLYLTSKPLWSGIASPRYGSDTENSSPSHMDCALISFGRQLAKRFNCYYYAFINYQRKSTKVCGSDALKLGKINDISSENTPATGSMHFEMELFNEPLWNYARVIGIKAKSCEEILLYRDALQNIVHSDLTKIENVTEMQEFQEIKSYVKQFETHGKSQKFDDLFQNFQNMSIENKIDSIIEFDEILEQIKVDYADKSNTSVEEVLHYCDALQMIVHSCITNFENLTELHEFKSLKSRVYQFENYGNSDKLHKFSKYFQNNSLKYKLNSLKAFLQILEELKTNYSGVDNCKLISSGEINFSKYDENEISKFGQILYELLKMHYPDEVKYDQKHQLMSFPLSIANHILTRFGEFVESNLTEESQIEHNMDFILTIQSAVAPGEAEMKRKRRQNVINGSANVALFKLLFSWAIRLCMQMEQNDVTVKKYLPSFLFGLKMSKRPNGWNGYRIYDYKMKIDDKIVKMSLPNWNLPYEVYLKNKKELLAEKAKENLNFLLSLSVYSPTIYEVLKMAKILHAMTDDKHILVRPSNPQILHFLVKYFKNTEEEITKRTELELENQACILITFVKDLLEKASEAKCLPDHDIVNVFFKQATQLCTEEKIKEETIKQFEANINLNRAVKLNFNIHKDEQLLSTLIYELEEMMQKDTLNFSKLFNGKTVEWKLFGLALRKNEKHEEIQNLMEELKKEYKKSLESLKNGKPPNTKEKENENESQKEKNLKELLEKLKKKIEIMEQENLKEKESDF